MAKPTPPSDSTPSPKPKPAIEPRAETPKRRGRWNLADFAPFATLLLVIGLFAVTVDGFLKLQNISLILEQAAVLGIAAAGLTFVLLCAEIDLSVGAVALLSAALAGVLFEQSWAAGPGGDGSVSAFDVTIIIAVPLLAALSLGLLTGFLTVRSGLPSFIISLAMLNIGEGLAMYVTTSQKHDVPEAMTAIGNGSVRLFTIGDSANASDWFNLPYAVMLAAVVLILSHFVLRHTRFGRQVYMTGGNREAARLAGVRTGLVIAVCLAISGLTAGIAGLLNAGRLGAVTLDQNAGLLLDAVACVVLGGTSLFGGEGGIGRTVIGVLTYTVLRAGLTMLQIPAIDNFDFLRSFLLGLVLLLSLLFNAWLQKRGARG